MTQPRSQYDVAIVGASIAGCTAATLYAGQGLSVALIEREADPHHYKKACTHFIQPSATPTIERLGLAERIEAAGGVRNGVDIYTRRWGWIYPDLAHTDYPYASYGYNIRREKLDPMVRDLAARAGVDLFLGHSVQGLLSEDGRVTGVTVATPEHEAKRIGARLVVGADGRNSRVARLAGVNERVRPNIRFAYWAYFRNVPFPRENHSLLWFLEPDTAYLFPNDDGLAILAVMPHKERLPEFKEDVEGAFRRYWEALPDAPSLTRAERVTEFRGMLEMPNISRRPVAPGLALIGDAAMASDPLWGVGCGWAFQTGEWLVEETAEAVVSGKDLDRALERYRKRHHAGLAGHHWLISDFSVRRSFNAIERLMFSAAKKDERCARHFSAFGSRHIGVGQFLSPGALARALWVNLRPAPSRGPAVPQGR